MTEIIEKVKQSKSERPVSQKDLTKFKKDIDALLETRFSDFVDGFLEAWSDAQNGDGEKCTCEECSGEDKLDNPRRYMIQAGGNTWWVDNFMPNPIYGIDCIWTEELGGKVKVVKGTIMDSTISIFDFESETTPEIFDNQKRQTVDYAIQMAREAQAKEKALKASQQQNAINTEADATHVSYG